MASNFLLFWLPETVEFHLSCNYLLRNVGSSQIQRASGGDTLWIVTLSEGFELGLAGRLRVGEIVPLAVAKQRLQTDDLWHSEYHALAESGTAERMKGIGMEFDAQRLRFVDGQPDRFLIHNGQINPDQLKRMRELDSSSAQLMEEIWFAAYTHQLT
jgi:hypothetical protein